jgi:AraC-like DNA-binding protein
MLTVRDHSNTEQRFSMHRHDAHELLWGATVELTVEQDDRVWVVPPMLGVLVPAGVMHGGFIASGGAYFATWFAAERCSPPWARPTPVAMSPAVRELILHAAAHELAPDIHERVERLVLDLLQPAELSTIGLPMPFDDRARTVANSLIAHPADDRRLVEWGRTVGASTRNLSRLFEVQTGMGFSRWRAHARVGAALADLAAGIDVATVARRVGYSNASAFTRTFRQITGQTPSAYFSKGTTIIRHTPPQPSR